MKTKEVQGCRCGASMRGPDGRRHKTNGIRCLTSQLEMAGGCLDMIGERLEAWGCGCGKDSRKSTPAMMYPEWIGCVIRHQVKIGKEPVERQLHEAVLAREYWEKRYLAAERSASRWFVAFGLAAGTAWLLIIAGWMALGWWLGIL